MRHWILLLAILFPACVRAQTDYSVGTLNVSGTGCTVQNTSDHIAIYTTGGGSATFTVQGTFVGTVSFFGSGDGGNSWGPLGVIPSAGGTVAVMTMGDGLWQANVAAYTHVCMMLTAFTSGTAYAKIHTSPISARSNGSGSGGGGGGPATVSLDAVTAAMSFSNINNSNNAILWNWQLPGSQVGFGIGESAASTGGSGSNPVNTSNNQNLLSVSTTTGSTATPFYILQNGVTFTAPVPAATIVSNWNNAAVNQVALQIDPYCAACGANSYAVNVINGLNSQSVFTVGYQGNISTNGNISVQGNIAVVGPSFLGNVTASRISGGTNTATLAVAGGIDAPVAGALGAGIFRGGDNNVVNNAAAAGGLAVLRGGALTASNVGMEGLTQVGSIYSGTVVSGPGSIVCATTVAFQVTNCPVGAVNIIGIAMNSTTPAYTFVASYGTAPVRIDAAGAIGNIVCTSPTNAGAGVDSGSRTAACANGGQQIGVIVATSGTVVVGSGTGTNTVGLTTTIPLVQLHIR